MTVTDDGVNRGRQLHADRHHRGTPEPLTREQVRASPIAAGTARWLAAHATAPVTGPDGKIVQRPDLAARAAARALLSAEDQEHVDRMTGRAGYDA